MFDRKMSEFNGITISLHINLVQAKDIFLPFILCARLTHTIRWAFWIDFLFFVREWGRHREEHKDVGDGDDDSWDDSAECEYWKYTQPPKNININKIRHCIESAELLRESDFTVRFRLYLYALATLNVEKCC